MSNKLSGYANSINSERSLSNEEVTLTFIDSDLLLELFNNIDKYVITEKDVNPFVVPSSFTIMSAKQNLTGTIKCNLDYDWDVEITKNSDYFDISINSNQGIIYATHEITISHSLSIKLSGFYFKANEPCTYGLKLSIAEDKLYSLIGLNDDLFLQLKVTKITTIVPYTTAQLKQQEKMSNCLTIKGSGFNTPTINPVVRKYSIHVRQLLDNKTITEHDFNHLKAGEQEFLSYYKQLSPLVKLVNIDNFLTEVSDLNKALNFVYIILNNSNYSPNLKAAQLENFINSMHEFKLYIPIIIPNCEAIMNDVKKWLKILKDYRRKLIKFEKYNFKLISIIYYLVKNLAIENIIHYIENNSITSNNSTSHLETIKYMLNGAMVYQKMQQMQIVKFTTIPAINHPRQYLSLDGEPLFPPIL